MPLDESDLDPLVDLAVTVEIQGIRALDEMDRFTDPDFYVKVFINNIEFKSDVWRNTKYVNDPQWSATLDVPDDDEEVSVKIQLFDKDLGRDDHCDIGGRNQTCNHKDIEVTYNVLTGHWYGNDYTENEPTWADDSGYGRACGCDDGSYNVDEDDCELWFNIFQNDFDGDTIPYWSEVNIYETDPEVDDTGRDDDNDSVPIEWEHRWGIYHAHWGIGMIYNAFEWEDHKTLDPDEDGLENYEEYRTSQWRSDPFRKDIFLELDQMEVGPNGEGHLVPELSKILIIDAFAKHNIVFHIDDGCMGGGDIIPFDESVTNDEMKDIYFNYFLNRDEDHWRQGAFHYGLIIYHSARYPGFVWNGGYGPYLDCFQISTDHHDAIADNRVVRLYNYNNVFFMWYRYRSFDPDYKRAVIYAGAMMHETGHTLGIFAGNTPGCDDQNGKYPWERNFWKWGSYKSCMNYRYAYSLVDYSDGSHHPTRDWNDWARLDLQFFQRALW